jgi:hypothetical protein
MAPRTVIAAAAGLVAVVLLSSRIAGLVVFPSGLDGNFDGYVALSEWQTYHAARAKYYGGYDAAGPIARNADYYPREFARVDCNLDGRMSVLEYRELRWNMRYCGSPR